MRKNKYVFLFNEGDSIDKVEVFAFNYKDAEILAKTEQIKRGRPYDIIKDFSVYYN